QVNPGGTATVTIPATTFSGTDASDLSGGRINYIHILSFPANATTVTFAAAATTPGGATANATYTTANFPVGGVYIATNAAGNPSSAIVVDPANGAVNVDFTYKVVDNANRESAASGIARQPLTDLTIAGTVYDDVTAGTIDGTPISNAGGQLYVNLVNTATNTVVASQALTDGTFSFGTADGLRNDIGTYRLVLTSSASATASTLPSTAWVYMAEGSSGTSGDALANGTFDFGGNVGTSRTIDFAIEALPVPAALTIATPQVNPGGTNTVTIPAATFVASDATDLGGGAVSYIRITALPANATSVTLSGSTTPGGPVSTVTYGTGFTAFPAGGVYLATNASGNPTQAITVDPVNGAVNVDFTFTAIDNSGKESLTSGIARQPLTDIAISGTIYDDVNGTKDGIINGTPVGSLSSTQLYVSLVSGGNVVATQAVAGNGTYSFSSANGVQTGTTYTVVLSTTAGTIGQPAPAAALPSGWVNTAEGTTAAGDGDHNGQASTGALAGNSTVNFGVNALPVATSSTSTALANPSGNTLVTIPSASFPGTDPEVNNTGEISFVHLTSFPSNVTSVYAYSSTSVNGPFAFATYTSFPAGGIYLPTSLPGYLLPVDALQIDPVDNALNAQFNYTIIDTAGYESNGAVTTVPFTLGAINGTVYNDFNALLDGLINGVGTNLTNQLYVNAVSGTTVAASAQVAADGTYVLAGLTTGTYTLTLTTSAAGNSAALPAGWNHTGEGVSATQPSGDGTPNGLLTVTIGSDGLAGANFGIDARPIANNATAPTQVNPGGTNTITIPATSFSGTDPDAANGGEIQYVRLMTFPTNVTSITVTGALTPGGAVTTTTYNSTDFPAGGIYFATEDNGNLSNANAFQTDPVNGSNSIGIQFKVVDNAGQQSLAIATLTQPLSDLFLTGTVYDDVNGGTINGTPIFNAGGPLFVNLVDTATNTVIASKQLTDGTFSFSTANGLQGNVGSYQLILAKSATATVASLPSTAWVYLAEGITGSTGDGNANGAYAFGGNVATSQVIDFAIDARPTASSNSAVTQVNPGGSNSVVVPAGTFSGSDAGDLAGGAISYVHLTAFPTNATSITVTGAATPGGAVSTTTYTSADFPAGGLYIATAANGNLLDANAVQVDPQNGAVTVGITYQVVDNSGVESTTPATASQPFSDLLISGTVYNDADGSTDALIDGTPISNAGGQLYVNLVNAQTGTVVASKLLTDGTYSFGTADGLESTVTTYQIVLANSPAALAPVLPNASAWVNTGEGLTATAGDGFPNGRYQVGTISASRTVDFGIDARPVPAILTTAPTQVNPGATNTVTIPATTFAANDATDISGGLVTYIHITAFPTNATTINFAAAATTLGGATSALSYNSGNFPAGGVYVATNGSGNPVSGITVDPVDGAVNVDISFRAIDNANQESSTTGIARQPLSDLLLTGNVYDDVDGGLIDGTRISTAGGQLFVNLVDTATNTVIASQQLTNGTFAFGTGNGLRTDVSTYKLVLTKTATLATPSLPSAAWVNLAEGLSGTTGDGLGNGGYALGGVVTVNTTVDFGVDARPVAVPLTVATPKVNPGGALFIGIANNLPLASDPVDVAGGQVKRLHVLTLPTNVDAIKVTASETPNGALAFTTYTAATFPAGGIYVATNASGSTLDSFFIDPINGTVTVEIQFRSIDQAGVESANIGLGQIPVGDLTISGSVYNDVNGNNDGIVNGTLISNAGGPLYVNLVDGTNTVISSKAVTGGAFSFGTADGLRNDDATYRVILAASPAATTQGLPNATEWVNTGEGPGSAPDGLPNGRYTLSAAVTAPLTVDFGIDARPVTNTLITATGQLNPGGSTLVTVPATTFAGTDADAGNGGVISFLHVTSFPTNATSIAFASAATTVDGTYGAVTYTAATFPAGGVYLATNTAGNPTAALQVDPVDGAVTVDISYRTIDNASVESNHTGIARQPFTALLVSGNVYDDYNGLTDALLNGTGTSAGNMLYVNAVSAGSVVASAQVLADGSWSIDDLTPGSYSLVLSTASSSSTAAVPAGWVIMGEGTGTGSDGSVNGSTPLTLVAANVTNINFTIERYATADDKIYSLGPNTNPNIEHTTIANTANPAQSYAARINLSGAASSGSTPGALTGLDADGNNGSALTLTTGTPNVSVLIDPASYSGLRYGQTFVDAMVVQYAGIQLQPGGCQAGDIGNGACSLYNNATGLWEIPAYDLSQLKVLVRNGAGSVSFNYAWKDAAGATGTFATYTIGFEQNLPVHLITFTGEKRGSNAVLNWKSVNESNFRGYGVERSLDGRSFTQVGFVNGRNLSSEQLYSYTDNLGSLPAGRVYYRLKQLDINGSFTYSPVVTLNLGSQGIDPGVTLLSNPVKSQLRLQVRTAAATKASLYLTDGNGRVVFRQERELPAGTTALSVDLPSFLAGGIYHLVTQFDGNQYNNKVLVDR
ncbi:hypothetical protein, partial [Flaviaesturariibacter aridisoli]|uniref:hypothetical protein n=1 Tax=Flaviaesturariibacter aridisoli TaxID=2545761 RepID=UPI0014053E55